MTDQPKPLSSEELDDLERLAKAAAGIEDRSAWTTKDWFTHLGAWENDRGQLCFGSSFAFGVLLEQFNREIGRQALKRIAPLLAEVRQLRADTNQVARWKRDSELLDAIEAQCWDVRYDSAPNADAGDSSISIEIVGHFMQAPRVRVVGENYTENLRAALEQAMTAPAYPPERPEYDDYGRPAAALTQGDKA